MLQKQKKHLNAKLLKPKPSTSQRITLNTFGSVQTLTDPCFKDSVIYKPVLRAGFATTGMLIVTKILKSKPAASQRQ